MSPAPARQSRVESREPAASVRREMRAPSIIVRQRAQTVGDFLPRSFEVAFSHEPSPGARSNVGIRQLTHRLHVRLDFLAFENQRLSFSIVYSKKRK
jgi:hypothetical protein